MKHSFPRRAQRAFTLIELLVAMTITVILVFVIMTMTNQAISIYKDASEQVDTSARARVALRSLSNDFQAMQIGRGANDYEWFVAEADDAASTSLTESSRNSKKKKNYFSDVTQLIFFASTLDRNAAVSSNEILRGSYRSAKANNLDTQGDVNAVGYRLLYRDQILNLGQDEKSKTKVNTFPLFSLYRQIITPRDAYQFLMAKTNLKSAYRKYENAEQDHFLCENIIDMNLVFDIQYSLGDADIESGHIVYETKSVPIISARGKNEELTITSRDILVNNEKLLNARISAINISITVVTEEGMHLIEQVRNGRRSMPNQATFFRQYTRTFTALVTPPSTS